MIQFGKIALLLWALALGYVGLQLINGQSAVLFAAVEAGRLSEALMQGVFITMVAVCTLASVALFLVVGILRE